MSNSAPEKATITNLLKNTSITCQFNPTTFTLDKSNGWQNEPIPGRNIGIAKFKGGQAAKISLDLLFDTSSSDSGDVRQYTDTLLEMMEVPKANMSTKTLEEPPRVRFQWGKIKAFEAVITSVSLTFKLFRPDGTPIRATAKVSFEQVQDEKVFAGQNPTSRSEARRVWVVVEGETLSWIAYREYGDPSYWRHIAETNQLANPLELRPGQVLNLVPLH